MKKIWNTAAPTESGWYWVKYSGKKGTVMCPSSIDRYSSLNGNSGGYLIRTARNDIFMVEAGRATHLGKVDRSFRFGPSIPLPGKEVTK
jgi:hypothetical protein